MAEKVSFYDLDYIIEINEKRLEQYSAAYQKNIDKFTNLLIIYSAIAIFLIPVIQVLFFTSSPRHWGHYVSFIMFAVIFAFSLVYTIRLLIPVEVAYLNEPRIYYETYRLDYENEVKDSKVVDTLIKASYIDELEKAVKNNSDIFKRKGLFYYRALSSSLACCIPYLLCLAFHFSIKEDVIQKVEIVNKRSIFNKISGMAKENKPATSGTTRLPNVNPQQVRPSNPQMVKENFEIRSTRNASKDKTNK